MYNNFYDELYHYGIPGMRKGYRRYTNPDGTLNDAGKRRYADDRASKNFDRRSSAYNESGRQRSGEQWKAGRNALRNEQQQLATARMRAAGAPSSSYITDRGEARKRKNATMKSMQSQAALRMGPAASSYAQERARLTNLVGSSFYSKQRTKQRQKASMESQAALRSAPNTVRYKNAGPNVSTQRSMGSQIKNRMPSAKEMHRVEMERERKHHLNERALNDAVNSYNRAMKNAKLNEKKAKRKRS